MNIFTKYIIILSIIVTQCLLGVPEGIALQIQPFTSPMSAEQEEENSARVFILERIQRLQRDGVSVSICRKVVLSAAFLLLAPVGIMIDARISFFSFIRTPLVDIEPISIPIVYILKNLLLVF